MNIDKANILLNYKLPNILQLAFSTWDKYHEGTIESWVVRKESPQLREYIMGTEVQQWVKKQNLELKAHLVIIVGSRHILLWDMDKEGRLSSKPRLVDS